MDALSRSGRVSYDCINDEAFLNLWHAANEHNLSYEEFLSLPMPEGADPDAVWGAITKLRKWSGHDVGPNETNAFHFWANLSRDGKHLAHKVIERTDDSSVIGRYIRAIGFKSAFVEAKVDSIRSSLLDDGMQTDYEAARSVLLEQSVPHNDAERLITNHARIVRQEYANPGNTDVTRNVRALYSELAEGVVDLRGVQWNMGVLSNLDACLRGASQAGDEMAFCAARYIWGAGHEIAFVSRLQATFTSLLRKVYFVRCGHPNLALVPLSSHLQSDGTHEGAVGGYDISSATEKMLVAIDEQLSEMESIADEWLRRANAVREAMKDSAVFNLRQKEVLSQALANQRSVFDYGDLAKQFQVSYNTVRTDMGRLVGMGLLYTSFNGHRVELHPVPGLMGTLERLVQE